MNVRNVIINAVKFSLVEPARQEPTVLLLALSTILITLGQSAAVPIIPLLVQSYGMAAAMVGVAVSAFALARSIANIPSGFLSRQYGTRSALVLGAVLAASGHLMVGLTSSYQALTASRFIAGLGSALYITAAVIFVAEVSTPNNRARLMGIYHTSFLIGIALGPSLGGFIAEVFGLRAPFLVVSALSLLAGIWSWTRIPPHVGRSVVRRDAADPSIMSASRERPKWLEIFLTPGFLAVSFICMGVFLTRASSLFNLLPLLAQERFGLSVGGIGLILTAPSAVNLTFQPFVGALADRFGRKILIVPAVFLFALSLVICAISRSPWLFLIGLACYGIGQSIEAPSSNSYAADILIPEFRAVGLGIFRTFGDIGQVIGGPLLGFVADQTKISWALFINAGIIVIPGLFFLCFAKETLHRN